MSEKQQTEKLRENSNQDHRETATGTHSAAWWRRGMWLAGLVLISFTLLGSPVLAQECTEYDSKTIVKARKQDNAPHFDKDCTDSKNHKDSSCSLWRSVDGACNTDPPEKWSSPHGCYNKGYEKYGNPPVVIFKKKAPYHFIAVPTVPVIGVEDKRNQDHPYFLYAWVAAALPAPNPHEIHNFDKLGEMKRGSIGLAINPAEKRSQHQLHIHIGTLKDAVRESLKGVSDDKTWHKLDKNLLWGKECFAKYFKLPFPSPFKEVYNFCKGDKDLIKRCGIILAGHIDDKGALKGFYVVSCKDAFVEGWLYYESGAH